ncbi:unnamed protein product [Pieris brassicae]|uniref:Fatty acid desaturase domain-containing protein n=1 Tax=Pieris brassicae TaxID=7116 RepID=A0A9P0T2H0_PIEBR|nr:unnamed protein product [Pieris brassicae]
MTLNVEETTWEPSDVVGVPKVQPWKYVVVYGRVVTFGLLQIAAVYGLYLAVTCAYWKTLIFNNIIQLMAAIGISAGNHRLWSHRAYKAKWPLQIILMIFTSMTYQFSIINWVRDHRLHHKYTDTDADPYNASRGLFFSHIGWLLVRKHPDVKKYGKNIDMIDIYGNPVLRFQKKSAELGNSTLNVSTWFIDLSAIIGLAYDLRTAPPNVIKSRKERTGDGTDLWGYNKTQ